MVAGTHLTVLDRRMINAALDTGREEVHTRRGSKMGKSLTIVPTDRETEMERYRLCTWQWQRAEDVEKHTAKGRLYHAVITDPDDRAYRYTLDIIELP